MIFETLAHYNSIFVVEWVLGQLFFAEHKSDIADYAHEEIDLVGATTYVAFLTRYAASKEAESKDPENSLSQVNKGNYFFYLVDADGKPTFRIELRVCHN